MLALSPAGSLVVLWRYCSSWLSFFSFDGAVSNTTSLLHLLRHLQPRVIMHIGGLQSEIKMRKLVQDLGFLQTFRLFRRSAPSIVRLGGQETTQNYSVSSILDIRSPGQGTLASHPYPSSEYPYLPTFPSSISGENSNDAPSIQSAEFGSEIGVGSVNEGSGTGLVDATAAARLVHRSSPFKTEPFNGTDPSTAGMNSPGVTSASSPVGDISGSGQHTDGVASEFPRDERQKAVYQPTQPDIASTQPSTITSPGTPSEVQDHTLSPAPPPILGFEPESAPSISRPPDLSRPSLSHLRSSFSVAPSTLRYSRDAGPLESSTPPPEELVMPPEYEDARQPWERRRDY